MSTFGDRLQRLITTVAEMSQAQLGADKQVGPEVPLGLLSGDIDDLQDSPRNLALYGNTLCALLDAIRRAGFTLVQVVEAAQAELLKQEIEPENDARAMELPAAEIAKIYSLDGADGQTERAMLIKAAQNKASASITKREPELNDSPVTDQPEKANTDTGLISPAAGPHGWTPAPLPSHVNDSAQRGEMPELYSLPGQATPEQVSKLVESATSLLRMFDHGLFGNVDDVESLGMLRSALEPFKS